MAEKLQTISEIDLHIRGMLSGLWSAEEAAALSSAIIEEYTGIGRAAQLAFGDRQPERAVRDCIMVAAGRAAAGEPLQYITGYTLFCGHRIEVGPGVLIPRPETEELAAMIISENPGFSGTITDLCTGSGAIAIALSLAFPGAKVTATELSREALAVAERNIKTNGAAVTLVRSDILSRDTEPLPAAEMVISNPPYVTLQEKKEMHRNVVDHEPHSALFVPDDNPLLYYKAIAGEADLLLLPGGVLWLEVNENHAAPTAHLFTADLYREVTIYRDINGKERFVKAKKI